MLGPRGAEQGGASPARCGLAWEGPAGATGTRTGSWRRWSSSWVCRGGGAACSCALTRRHTWSALGSLSGTGQAAGAASRSHRGRVHTGLPALPLRGLQDPGPAAQFPGNSRAGRALSPRRRLQRLSQTKPPPPRVWEGRDCTPPHRVWEGRDCTRTSVKHDRGRLSSGVHYEPLSARPPQTSLRPDSAAGL